MLYLPGIYNRPALLILLDRFLRFLFGILRNLNFLIPKIDLSDRNILPLKTLRLYSLRFGYYLFLKHSLLFLADNSLFLLLHRMNHSRNPFVCCHYHIYNIRRLFRLKK